MPPSKQSASNKPNHSHGTSSPSNAHPSAGSKNPKPHPVFGDVDDPRDDETLPVVDDPRDDETLPPVDDPNSLLQALVQSLHAEGGGASWNLQMNPGSGSCCCHDKNGEDEEAPDGTTGLEKSGFVIVSVKPPHDSATADSLCQLAEEATPPLQGLLEALGCSPTGNARIQDENGPAAADSKLESWPLVFFCRETARGPGAGPLSIKREERCASILAALENQATTSPLPPLRSLRSYWRVDARQLSEAEAEELVRRLNALGHVQFAYREVAADDPGSQHASFGDDQSYLDEAPLGTGARCLPPLDAKNIRIVDLEQGWNGKHCSLELARPLKIFTGANRNDAKNRGHHGTAVLGQLCGKASSASSLTKDNLPSPGVEGFLPGADLSATSHYFGATVPPLQTTPGHPLAFTNGHIANAIVGALWGLAVDLGGDLEIGIPLLAGQLLLIEAQRGGRPVEAADLADFDAIRLASALGVAVIAAAGNGGADLDAEAEERGWPQISRRAAGFRDSGAILVGAAKGALPHNRLSFSNYGSRVDCYGWGDRVTSCGYGDLYGEDSDLFNDFYTGTFGGTSGAAAVIAGVAALLQGLQKETLADPLAPLALRSVLADPATGTPQGPDVGGPIGVMPNLKAIAVEALCLGAKTYLRNHPCDDGLDPEQENLTSSPDIIVTEVPKPPTKPKKNFGEDGGFVHAPAIGFPGNPSLPKELYVRARNAGSLEEDLEVDLYARRPASLLTPGPWRLVGETASPFKFSIEPGDQLAVSSPPLIWTPNKDPLLLNTNKEPEALKEGEAVAWLAVAREQADAGPTPLPPDGRYFRFSDLLAFHRQRKVACRNSHRVKAAWVSNPASAAVHPLTFDLTSAPDQPRHYNFEIIRRLPKAAKLSLEIPLALAAKLRQSNPLLSWQRLDQGNNDPELRVQVQLPAAPCLQIRGVSLAAGICCPAIFHMTGPPLEEGHSLALRQLVQDAEVGRISWYFM